MLYTYKLRTVDVRVSESEPRWFDGLHAGDPETGARLIHRILESYDDDVEHFVIVALDGRHRPNGFKVTATGTRSQTPVDPARLFRLGLALDAAGLLLAHTHPSGEIEPSRDDLNLTRRLVSAGELVGVAIFDHFILGPDRGGDREWLSLRSARPSLWNSRPAHFHGSEV